MENNNQISFNKWLKSKFILPTISFGVITLIFGILNFSGYSAIEIFSTFSQAIKKFDGKIFNWTWVFSFLNFTFSLYVVIIGANKFKISNEEDTNIAREQEYYRYLSLKKGILFSKSNSKKDWQDFKKGVNKTIKQFTWFWILSWIFYAVIYFLKLVNSTPEWLANLFNNLGSLMFIFLFMTMTVSTSQRKFYSWFKFIFIFFVLSVIEIKYFSSNNLTFGILSGIFGGVAIASFTGAIDSKFVNFPIWIILSLYLYAVIQGFYIIIEYDILSKSFSEIYIPIILAVALILKIILFWGVTWMLRTNRLLFAIFEEGSLNYQREINYKNFNSIVKTQESKLI